jgi:DNA-directed RNA polymerase subunit F
MNKSETKKTLHERFMQSKREHLNRFEKFRNTEDEAVAKKIMDNIHNTPLGKLLGIIATLPEIRPEKVQEGRRLVRRADTELNEQLNEAMDRVLEELLHEG